MIPVSTDTINRGGEGGKTKVLVLGAGRVGAAIALDLRTEGAFQVTAADRADAVLAPLADGGLDVVTLDLVDGDALERTVADHDLVVGAVPGALGFEALRRVVEAGRDVVDISFSPEDPFALDTAARARGVRVVVDAGVAPGLGNLIVGHHRPRMETTESFTCLVGGLPAEPVGPWAYRAPFSPVDVLEEYTRPARIRREGKDLVLPALSEVEDLELHGVGPVEAFLTDGLRTLLRTMDVPEMLEKTVRYRGHAALARALRDSGFLGDEPLEVDGARVRPRDLTARLLDDAWRFRPGEHDLTILRVEVVGREKGRRVRHVYDLLDRWDAATSTSSMARTTGYTCSALVRWLARGGPREPGVVPPEILAREEGCLRFVRRHLEDRRVMLGHRVLEVGGG